MKNNLFSINAFRGLAHLFFPKICLSCETESPLKNNVLCLDCQQDLYYTDHIQISDNEFERMFYGRLKLEKGASLFYYRKETTIQKLIHRFNYSGIKDVGKIWGNEMANYMLENKWGKEIDLVIPVPMHWRKERKRGYNQAAILALGIAEKLQVTCRQDGLIKEISNESQTKKSRSERVENVRNAFKLNTDYDWPPCNVLLVDDVLTTGATLEACARAIPSSCKIYMVTLAIGRL